MPDNQASQLVLSSKARRVGGALAQIFNDPKEVESYAFGAVKSIQARAIGDLVVSHPKLNTHQSIGGLLWLSTFHAEEIGLWMDSLLLEHDLDNIIIVVEYLYEVGQRSHATSALRDAAADLEVTREFMPLLLDLLENHRELQEEQPIRSADSLATLVHNLGGLYQFRDHDSPERIADALYDHRHGEE
jgi:hypothetical protein